MFTLFLLCFIYLKELRLVDRDQTRNPLDLGVGGSIPHMAKFNAYQRRQISNLKLANYIRKTFLIQGWPSVELKILYFYVL